MVKNQDLKFAGFAPVFSKNNHLISETHPLAYDDALRSSHSDMRDGNDLKTLPYSREEVEQIVRLFRENGHGAKGFIEKEANEQNLKAEVEGYDILHIATHGYSSLKSPELSGLYMHGPKAGDSSLTNDGFVYLKEIFSLPLHADLVVLSACKSGVGKFVEGEGVMALPRAFIFKGVPNLLVSLWKVHDKKTKDLMLDFYQELLTGKPYAGALRQAKLRQIEKGEHPMDWAGIVLIGR